MRIKFLMVILTILASVVSAEAQIVSYPVVIRRPDGKVWITSEALNKLRKGEVTTSDSIYVKDNVSFYTPTITLDYQVETLKGNNTQLISVLNKPVLPKLVLRIPKECGDAKFADMIERKLSQMGFTVMDRHLAEGVTDTREIARRTGADILLDVSWLQFSDPDMYGHLTKDGVKFEGDFSNASICWSQFYYHMYEFKKEDDLLTDRKPAHTYKRSYDYSDVFAPFCRYDFSKMSENIYRSIYASPSLNTNKNVVSAVYKFVNLKDGALIGFYQVGIPMNDAVITKSYINVDGVYWNIGFVNNNIYPRYSISSNTKWHAPWVKEEYLTGRFKGSNFEAAVLARISCVAPIEDNPFAAQLNDFRPAKLTDETIIENSQTSTRSSSSYRGSGTTYYNRYFNTSYWGGSGRGSSQSTTNTTTTFKEAEYLQPSDLYGYYTPLTDKLIEILKTK